jgi:hypothetical protein
LRVEVAVGRRRAAQRVGLVGDAYVQRIAVRLGVDGDASDAGVAARPSDADGDLAAVGDENLAHRSGSPRDCEGA